MIQHAVIGKPIWAPKKVNDTETKHLTQIASIRLPLDYWPNGGIRRRHKQRHRHPTTNVIVAELGRRKKNGGLKKKFFFFFLKEYISSSSAKPLHTNHWTVTHSKRLLGWGEKEGIQINPYHLRARVDWSGHKCHLSSVGLSLGVALSGSRHLLHL